MLTVLQWVFKTSLQKASVLESLTLQGVTVKTYFAPIAATPHPITSEHERKAWTVCLNWEPEHNASNVSLNCSSPFQIWKLQKQIQYKLIAGFKIASSKELDAPTSVPVISATISPSLSTHVKVFWTNK